VVAKLGADEAASGQTAGVVTPTSEASTLRSAIDS
jgi:hypothetical protein